MIYVDANIFIHAAIDPSNTGAAARKILKEVESGKLKATTSAITWQEVVWVITREIDEQAASDAGGRLLGIPNLTLVNIDRYVLEEAAKSIAHQRLKPQDAIHHATMKIKNIAEIITEDSDFESIKEIKRYSATAFAQKL